MTRNEWTRLRLLLALASDKSLLAASTARMNDLNTYTSTQQTNLKVQESTLAATDPVALATQLSATQTQRTALLSSLAMLGKGSLFDYL